MPASAHRHRGAPKQRLSVREAYVVVAVVTITALLAISLVRHLWSVLAG